MQDAEIKMAMRRQMPHTGNESLFKRAIVGPFGEDPVDGRVVDSGFAIACPGHWQALPLHACIEHPEDEVEDAMITEFAPRPPPGHRKVREDKCDELRPGELHGNRRRGLALGHIAHPDMAS